MNIDQIMQETDNNKDGIVILQLVSFSFHKAEVLSNVPIWVDELVSFLYTKLIWS